jgi:hypothetical protein
MRGIVKNKPTLTEAYQQGRDDEHDALELDIKKAYWQGRNDEYEVLFPIIETLEVEIALLRKSTPPPDTEANREFIKKLLEEK